MGDLVLTNPNGILPDDKDIRLTPQWLFDHLDREFHFGIDAAALPWNAKCDLYITPEQDALGPVEWHVRSRGRAVFCNPPFTELGAFCRKAVESMHRVCVVMVMPADRCEQAWFQHWVLGHAAELRYPKGRVQYDGAGSSPNFPSMVVVWRPGHYGPPVARRLVEEGRS